MPVPVQSVDVRFGVLGPLEVIEDGRPVAVRGTLQRRLLALLLSRANSVVSTDALIEALWDGAPPPSAGKTLQSHVVRLRDAVDPGRRLLETRPPGYMLHAGPDDLDALRFEQLVARARRVRAAGVAESAAAMLADALGLWRGPAYADLLDSESLSTEAARLEQMRLGALEERIDADLALGGGPDLVPELEASLVAHPFRERLWTQLAVGLYRSGRQADALAALGRARSVLRDELGLDPGPELRRVEEAILAQDPSLEAPGEPAARPVTVLPSALAADAWPVVGRDAELRWLLGAWADAARSRGGIVVVRGPAGIGRTRLLAEFARRVSASGVRVLHASGRAGVDPLADALRQGGAPLGTEETGPSAVPAVVTALRRAAELVPTLVALDDVHLADDAPVSLEPAAAAARDLPLLLVASYDSEEATPALRALADRLDPDGRRTWELAPLPQQAVEEIVGRVAQDADRDELAEAAAATGGHPRHLRLAVARVVEEAAGRRLDEAARRAEGARRGLAPVRQAVTTGILDLRAAREERAAAAHSGPPAPATCPYKGLARYDVADAEFFVGREQLTAQLVARVVEDDLLVVVGASGSGKSSVARAGLLAALAEGVLPGSDRWRQVRLVPGGDPPAALRRALDGPAPDAVAVDADGEAPLVVLVDQFEEVFTSCADEELRRAFVTELLLLGCEREVRVVLTLRADYYGRCAAYPDLAARLSDSSVLVGPLTDAELARVVEVPAHRAGLTVTPELPGLVVAEVAGAPSALPLVSTALLRTWEHRHGTVLSASSYREGGGIARAVERLGESAYERLDPAAAAAARRLLLRLADPGPAEGTLVRRRAPLVEVVAGGDETAARALAVLTERRLVSVTDDTVEVAHEALFAAWPRLRAWLEEDAAGRRLVRHLTAAAADWQAGGRDPAELYRGTRLQAGLDWAAVHGEDLTPLEREFLDASAAEADRQRRQAAEQLARERAGRRRPLRVLTALAVVLTLAVAAAALALDSRREAEDAARVAEARRLGALGVITQDLDRALLLAVQAVRIDDSAETRGDLLATLLRSPAALGVVRPPGGHRLLALDVAPDGESVLAGDNAGHLLLVDTETRQIDVLARPEEDDETIQVAEFSADGGAVAALRSRGNTSAVEVWDLATRTARRLPGPQGPWGIGWSPTGRRLAVVEAHRDAIVVDVADPDARPVTLLGSHGQEIGPVRWLGTDAVVLAPRGAAVGVWDAASGRLTGRLDISDEGVRVAGSPDGRVLAVGATSSEVRLYDGRTLRRTALLTGHRAPVNDVAFSPDGRSLASAGDDREVLLWDVGTGSLRERLPGHAGRITRVHWAPDGRTLWSASLDGTLLSWDGVGNQGLVRRMVTGPRGPDAQRAVTVTVSADGRVAAGTYEDGTAQVWDVPGGRALRRPMQVSDGLAFSTGLSSDGSLLVVGNADGTAPVWETRSGRRVGEVSGLSGVFVNTAHFSPDDRQLALGDEDGQIWLVDLDDPGWPAQPVGRAGRDPMVNWSPDGRLVAVSSFQNPDVVVWERETRRRVAVLPGVADFTPLAALSPDGRLAVTGGSDGALQFWDTTTWQPTGRPIPVAAGFVVEGGFSSDGRLLVTSGTDGTVRLVDVATRRPIGRPLPGVDNEDGLAWWTGERTVTAPFRDGSVYAYDVDPASWLRRACDVAGRELTEDEWRDVLPDRPYERTCPDR